MYSADTYQFDDYSKYVADSYDPVEKAKRRAEVFPLDCEKAFEMGKRFVQRQKGMKSTSHAKAVSLSFKFLN